MATDDGASAARSSHLVLEAVATQRVSDVIAERLTLAIREGTLKPGDRLPTELELARDFGVGRTSVREGLQKLRAHGLIESRKGLGAFVAAALPADPLADFARWTTTDPRAIEDLVEGRFALEALAAALAALRGSPEEVATLEGHHRAHAEAGGRGDAAAVIATDEAFHAAIMAAARNQFLQRMYGMFIAELTEFRRNTLALPWAVTRSANGHAAILEAIRRRDPAAARAAMIEHLWVLYDEVHQAATAEGEHAEELRLLPREALG
jgi:GntR family transcriptional regulator, transcriptional repressor for pyruvate dehydrogenase complex